MATKAKQETQQGLGFMSGQQGNVARTRGDQYPLLQWLNGKPNKGLAKDDPRVTGGFFYKVQEGEKFPVGTKMEVVFGNGDASYAYGFNAAHLAVIAEKIDWFTGDKNSKTNKPVWHAEYKADMQMKGRNRFLVYLRGAEAWHEANGPLMISLYGVNGLKMARDVVGEFRKVAHKAAERLAGGAQLDAYTFFIGVTAGPREKASANFDSMITPPALSLEIDGIKFDKADPVPFLEASFIKPAGMALCGKYWDEAMAWRKAAPVDETPAAQPQEEEAPAAGGFDIGDEPE